MSLIVSSKLSIIMLGYCRILYEPLWQASQCSFILVSSLLLVSQMYIGFSTTEGDSVHEYGLVLHCGQHLAVWM